MAASEHEIRRVLRRHLAKFDSGVAYRDIFDRALQYAGRNPNATLEQCMSFAFQVERPAPASDTWKPSRDFMRWQRRHAA